jgi:23S rRNA (guanosine2251-2'-O)-methyltransferase
VLILDSLEDPQNVGSLLRSAEAAGVHGVIFPTRRQAPLSPAAIKASSGATEHLLLAPVDDLPGAMADLHGRGLRLIGGEGDAPLTARQTDLRGPIAIIVGSEGQGLSPAVRRRCDAFMRIPMRGTVASLNAAVAGSILVFEAATQRDPDGRPTGTPGSGASTPGAAVEATVEGPIGATPEPAEGLAPPEPPKPAEGLDPPEPAEPAVDDDSRASDPDDDLLPGGPAAAGSA